MRNILLLTDFSENSKNAIQYALQLYKDNACNFFLLYVQSSTSYMSDDLILSDNKTLYNSIVKPSKDKLKKLAKELEDKFKNEKHNFKAFVDYDILTDAVNQNIKSNAIDLIIMGTNGVTGAKEAVFGSNTINIVRKVNCPTMVIPEGFKYRKPKEILLPLDLFDSIGGNAFKDVLNFTKQFGEHLHLLRIKPNNKNSKEELNDKEYIDNLMNEVNYQYHVVSDVPMQYTVSCYTQTHNIDLTVLLVQKESLFERFFIGSPTTQISNKIKVPLLVFHS